MFYPLLKRITFLFLSLLMASFSFAQSSDLGALRNVIPPSPNSSSIAKYGSWPVSEYTGLPNISIPLYELKSRSSSVPVSLSYHAAGNKVGEIASWVGLGWALNAGGVIARSMRGLPDEEGYFTNAQHFANPNNFASAISDPYASLFQVGAAKNNTDMQEDVYSLSALGKSYKLIIFADGTVQTIPYSNIKIVSNPMYGNGTATTNNSWSIILEDGTQLLFGSGNSYIENTNDPNFPTGDGKGISYISSWYLHSIVSITGETITFTYTSASMEQDSYVSQSDYIEYRTSTAPQDWSDCNALNEAPTASVADVQTINGLNLASIESDLTKISFLTSSSERLDLKGGNALSEMKVYSKLTATYVTDYKFYTSFATAVSGNAIAGGTSNTSYFGYRLHLDSVCQLNTTGTANTMQKWSFAYNAQNLPSRRSTAQDYWGFFNGATNNTSLAPPTYFQFPNSYYGVAAGGIVLNDRKGFIPPYHDVGANRSVNSNYMQAEMLTSIRYPTGGTTSFLYEPNSYPDNAEQFSNTSQSASLNVTQSSSSNYQTFTFTVTKAQYIQLALSSSISQSILNDQPGAKVGVVITDQSGNAVISTSGTSTTSFSTSIWFNLRSAGTYTLKLSANVIPSGLSIGDVITAHTTLSYQVSNGVQAFTHYAGGLRLSSITDNDGMNLSNSTTRYFKYEAPFVINPIDTVNDYLTTTNRIFTGEVPVGDEDGTTDFESCQFIKTTRNTSTKFAFGAIEGGTIGYGKVTTYYGLNGINGYTISYYNSAPDNLLQGSLVFPYPPADSRSHRRGLLLQQDTYTSLNQIAKRTYNTYSFSSKGSIQGYKAGYSTVYSGNSCLNQYQDCGITNGYVATTCEQVNRLSSTNVDFNVSTGDSLSTTTLYSYEDVLNTQPTRAATMNSKGDSIVTYSRTALEKSTINGSIPLSTTASAAIDTMNARNMVGIPLETEKYVKNVLISKSITNYKVQGSNLVMPDNVMLQVSSNPIETRVQFNRYDTYGNLSEQQKVNDAKHSYIWDYTFTYPVADAINTDSTSIAYTSFEADGKGGWTFSGAATVESSAPPTGNNSYNLAGGSVSKTGLTSTTTYIVSYWTKNAAACTISGTATGYPIKGRSLNGWTYYEHKVTGVTSVTLSGSGSIDELRLYPANAQMTTYTYTPLVGMTSQCDAASHITYYQYDGLQRLTLVRDQNRNILKRYSYVYQTPATVTNNTSISCTNTSGYASYSISFTNTTTGETLSFSVPVAGGTLGSIPSGTYNIVFTSSPVVQGSIFKVGCSPALSASGTSATFANVVITSSTCNTATITAP